MGGGLEEQSNPEQGVSKIASSRTKRTKEAKPETIKRVRCELSDFIPMTTDPVVANFKNIRNYEENLNIDGQIEDQIALEGLTGLTFGRLLQLLDAIFPKLNCLQDPKTQSYIWSVLIQKYLTRQLGSSIQAFFYNPSMKSEFAERSKVANKGIIMEKPSKLPQQTVIRLGTGEQALHPIQDGLIFGSCAFYLDRKNISQDIINIYKTHEPLESIYEAHKQFDLKHVYFVADQQIRNKAILPDWCDPNIYIRLREYATLELIGKTRTLGAVFPNDKALGRYRIFLSDKGLITQYQQTCQSHIVHHLKRFSRYNAETLDLKAFNKRGVVHDTNDEYVYKPSIRRVCTNLKRLRSDCDMLKMVYDVIAQSKGLSPLHIRRKLRLPKNHIRNHLKNLGALHAIGSHVDRTREKVLRIYRARLKSKKRARQVEIQKPRGVIAQWDEIDLKAKNMLGQRRSSFTQAEDSFLILCRITSLLVDAKVSSTSFCVHKRLIRDLLHEEFVESHDKTADSCLRRMKYLKRLPHNIMSINEITAELQDDSDIIRLTKSSELATSDDRIQKVFIQVLRTVRAKLPYLLGLDPPSASQPTSFSRNDFQRISSNVDHGVNALDKPTKIKSYKDLMERFELVDCQSVASLAQAPTFDPVKNIVDCQLNNVCLVTLAYALTSSFDATNNKPDGVSRRQYRHEHGINDQQIDDSGGRCKPADESDMNSLRVAKKRIQLWMLDKFYSNYPDKLISSVLSKLHKRSILTRKCPLEQAVSQCKPSKARTSHKLNKSVLFLLNRYHSSSLMQLANPIGQDYRIDMSESNEIASIAILAAYCSQSLLDMDLRLKIPVNPISVDQANESFRSLYRQQQQQLGDEAGRKLNDALIVHPCNMRFSSSLPLNLNSAPLEGFLSRHEVTLLRSLDSEGLEESQAPVCQEETIRPPPATSKWLVKGVRLGPPVGSTTASLPAASVGSSQQSSGSGGFATIESDEKSEKMAIQYEARLWKSIDGAVHIGTLFRLLESLLSWIITFPGVEFESLERGLSHLIPVEHLQELLDLMEGLELVSSGHFENDMPEPRLFGYRRRDLHHQQRQQQSSTVVTYEPRAGAYIRYCQLMDQYIK